MVDNRRFTVDNRVDDRRLEMEGLGTTEKPGCDG
jgi:hypothetical protein